MELESVCRTCLAGDRILESPGQYEPTLNVVAPHVMSVLPLSVGICWECRALLRRIHSFTIRSHTSAILLSQYWTQACNGQIQETLEHVTKRCQSTLRQELQTSLHYHTYLESSHEGSDINHRPIKSEFLDVEIDLKSPIKEETNFDLDDEIPLINHKREKKRKKREKYRREDKKSLEVEFSLEVEVAEDGDIELNDDIYDEITNKADEDARMRKTKTLKRTKAKVEQKKVRRKKSRVEVPPESERYRTVLVSEEELALWRAEDAKADRYTTMRLPHKCASCLVPFRWEEQLSQHKAKKHNPAIGAHCCDVCACRFSSDTDLATHRRLHLTRYECLHCDYVTRDKKDIDKHYEVEHCEAKYKCTICGEAFKTFFQQRYHREAAHRPLWECQHCDKTFRLRGGLYSHMRIHQELPKAECPICSKTYKNKYALMYHLRVHEESKWPFYCRPCDVHFKSKNQLRLHTTTSMKHITPDKLKFACSACGRRFITEKRREHHYDSVHLNKTEFACTECSKAYANKQSLRSHVLRKHKQTSLPRDKICDICGKGFHITWYMCGLCGQNNVLLRNHMRTHTGERPFHCTLCPSTFSYSAALYTHNRLVHLKMKREKTYKKKAAPAAVYPEKTQWEGDQFSY